MSFWGAFTGSDAKKGALASKQANDATANQGFSANQGYLDQGYGAATGRLQGYASQGGQANTAYGNLLGLGGTGAQGQAQQGYQGWNPHLSGDMDMATRSVARRMNAGGQYNSGMNALAQQRATQELGSRDFYNYNDRLQGQAQQGFGASSQLAGIDGNFAQARVGNRNALSGQLTGNESAYNTQYQQGNTAGLQNIMGVAGLGLQAAGLYNSWGKPKEQPGNNYASPASWS